MQKQIMQDSTFIVPMQKMETYVKVNIDIIPADAGGVNGASYQFIDTAVKNRFKKCFYKLGDVDNSGAEVIHGPISVSRRPK